MGSEMCIRDRDIQFQEGAFIPIAFAAWDGSNSEAGSKHTMTTWYWLLLTPPTGMRPYIGALVVIGLIAGAELFWVRSAGRRRDDNGEGVEAPDAGS